MKKKARIITLLTVLTMVAGSMALPRLAWAEDAEQVSVEVEEDTTPTPAPATPEPTKEPTPEPTAAPTPEPTAEPTKEPTPEPTAIPTPEPTAEPTKEPTPEPTKTAEPAAETKEEAVTPSASENPAERETEPESNPNDENENPAEETETEDSRTEEEAAPEIDKYDTPLGALAFTYEYEKDAEGALVLDSKGDPIVILQEGQDIPKAWLRNSAGDLILDGKGNPIATQTVPAQSVYLRKQKDKLDPNRSVDLYVKFDHAQPVVGDKAIFKAVLHGYDNLIYTIQWQQSHDGANWENVDVGNVTEFELVTNKYNIDDFWRVVVTIYGIRG